MKLVKINRLSPKRLFGSKKDRSGVARSDDPSSFGYGTTSSSSSCSSAASSVHKPGAGGESRTPTSVLPPQLSGEWSDAASSSADLNCELARAFTYIDGDNDGVLSRDELEALLTRLGAEPLNADERALMLREVGCADDGGGGAGVRIEDLLSRVGSAGGDPDCDVEMRRTFEFFDRDGDGRITAEELLGAFGAMGDGGCTLEECRRMIAQVDRNGDGFVCFEDFSRMMELQI
ncbi:probable calcium-binding protein CML36 [Rhodamnia argentea]|uniref:Probable calcium-binding protein CML36 n=1 Tax=Rhodamnia argentea TaxID=178133 RepID=A0A8B8NUE0_9MYRT|nr:probable calcium-binding protein CML36 [Rhodamnia argentea]